MSRFFAGLCAFQVFIGVLALAAESSGAALTGQHPLMYLQLALRFAAGAAADFCAMLVMFAGNDRRDKDLVWLALAWLALVAVTFWLRPAFLDHPALG